MSGVKEERSISLLLRLDLEFLESTPKTLINSLHATARNFDTPSYWTLTEFGCKIMISDIFENVTIKLLAQKIDLVRQNVIMEDIEMECGEI